MLIVEKLSLKVNLSETEEIIAAFLVEQGIKIRKYSTRNLAEATYTSPATIVRLCKKLGFKGFDDFKEQFLKEIQYLDQQYGDVDINFPFSKNDTIMKAANKISHLYEETIHDTISLLQHDALQKVITLFKYCQTIYIFSAGTSLNQAESFREKMLKIGKHVSISNNLNYQLYEAGCLSNKDVAILISYSGETDKTLQVAEECKKKSVPIIAITSFGENSLSKFATCKLIISTKESMFQNLGDYSTHLSIALILDILYSTYFLQDYENNYQKKLEKARVLEKLRRSTNSIIMKSDDE
ncbi:MurR/RpiR family transcriptional regulator [Lacrimispora sp.]|jgi:DNA-binding MurR/RpiR family transcriptional regulator|uniref:MurR/RpiR family transcriptional regulator n=1 Tax=Lacrimispora sp. TaxID=2719234 RepID=UPI0028A91FC6|nr:MurR/RpiR family transcriptional regulator [Lacrimispora sp.]